MRNIKAEEITKVVERLFISANKILPKDLEEKIKESVQFETDELPKSIMCDLCENMKAARDMDIPICQDTGMAVVFAEIGQDVHIEGNFENAVNLGVKNAYINGLLRCSVVKDPLFRVNTDDNTPAIIHTKLVDGDKITIMAAPKGFGSENMSRIKMFNPSAKEEEIVEFVKETVIIAGSNPCPPIVLGVGIGGDFEYSAVLAKKALCRNVSQRNELEYYRDLEKKMLDAVNKTGVGPQGFGGKVTALAVNIEQFPTHIAGLPVAVNVGCHVTRHKKMTI